MNERDFMNVDKVYENKINNVVPKFRHKQKIDIIEGFYRGNSGIITGYILKDDIIYYHVDIVDLNIVLMIDERDLREFRNVNKSFISKFFIK